MTGKIFINYRRDDSAAHALNIAQYLEREFGSKNIFIDVDRLGAGQDFPSVLQEKLDQCSVMIAVIGPRWLTLTDESGKRRIDDPDDWVRLEISNSLARKIAVIPVVVGGASLPNKSDLPEELRPILRRHAATLTTHGFRNEMAGLKRDILEIPGFRPRRVGVYQALGALAVMAGLVGGVVMYGPLRTFVPQSQESSGNTPLTDQELANLVRRALELTAAGRCSADLMTKSLFSACEKQLSWLGPSLRDLGPIQGVRSLGLGESRGAKGSRFDVAFNSGASQIWLATANGAGQLSGLWRD